MKKLSAMLVGCLLLGGVVAQGEVKKPAVPRGPKLSAEARQEIAAAHKLVRESRKVTGPERSRKLEVAAAAFDRIVVKFVDEPAAAAQAAWNAAETWRRHGSAPLAEKDYLHAAKVDAVRYGQRGLFGAAEMQRRQHRTEDAMKTYKLAEAVDPRTSRAHDARLWMARMMLDDKKTVAAIEQFRVALESAPSSRKAIQAADYLAKAWIVKGDLEAAGFVIDHARTLVADEEGGDPVVVARLHRAFERMGAHRALRRAQDAQDDAAGDAVRLEQSRKKSAPKKRKPKKRSKAKKTKRSK